MRGISNNGTMRCATKALFRSIDLEREREREKSSKAQRMNRMRENERWSLSYCTQPAACIIRHATER